MFVMIFSPSSYPAKFMFNASNPRHRPISWHAFPEKRWPNGAVQAPLARRGEGVGGSGESKQRVQPIGLGYY